MNASPRKKREGKYLTFALGDEEYGIDALRVQGILCMQQITPMPHAPHYVKGVTTVRGKVAPIISARLKLGMMEVDYTSETCIILVALKGTWMGLVVDTVRDVIDIWENQIEDPPQMSSSDNGDIVGIAKIDKKVIVLLDIDKAMGDAFFDADADKAALDAFPLE